MAINVAPNTEKTILDVLKLQWSKASPFSAHLRIVKTKLSIILASKRVAGSSTAINIVTSLIIRDLLDRMSDQTRYRLIHQHFFEEMVGKDTRRWGLVVTPHPVIKISFFLSQFTELSFDELLSALEKVDLAHASAGLPHHRPGFKPKHKDTASFSQRTSAPKVAQEHRKGAVATRGKPRVHSLQALRMTMLTAVRMPLS